MVSTNPSEKYAKVKWGSSSPNFGVKIKKIFELPPPSEVINLGFVALRCGWKKHQTILSQMVGLKMGMNPMVEYVKRSPTKQINKSK